MGAGFSRQNPASAEHKYLVHFHDSLVKYAGHASLEAFTHDNVKLLALAYQASDADYEGSPTQHLRFALSKDGGDTWTPHRIIAWGLGPVWAPVLYYHAPSSTLYLFYSESRKAMSPGGDIKFITSTDQGTTWSPPTTIHTHEAGGEVPKVTANRPVVAADGTWYLPFHTEPAESFKVLNAGTWCPLADAGDKLKPLSVPAAAAPQSAVTTAGVLVSTDGGATWAPRGHVEDPKTWLIQPTVNLTSTGGLVMLFRTSAGRIYSSKSTDGGNTWSRPGAVSVPDPNSKFATLAIDGQLVLVHHASPTALNSLMLSLSVNDGRRFDPVCAVEEAAADAKLVGPTIVEWNDETVKLAYTVWGQGLRLATLTLQTVDG